MDEIEQNIHMTEKWEDKTLHHYYLELNNKFMRIDIYFYPDDFEQVVNTNIWNIAGEKIPGTTTVLYQKAKEIMQQLATESGRAVRYVFATDNPSMVAWGLSKGKEIFSWDDEKRNGNKLHAEKIFSPQG